MGNDCENCGNRCMDMDLEPFCSAVNKPYGVNLARGKPKECGEDSLLWREDTRGKTLKTPVVHGQGFVSVGMSPSDIDDKVLARIKPPFTHESFEEKEGAHGQRRTRYRIHDANDDALCSSYDKVYADFIVAALNAYKPR